jgi:predicted dienelactone hydrolase
LLFVAVFLSAGAPVFTYPQPTGPYAIGITRLTFVDRARSDPFAPTKGTPREILTAVWYPATMQAGAKPAPFWPADADVEQGGGIPRVFFSHLRLVPSHSYADAPMANAGQRFPVIVFSHGYDSCPWQNVPQMEELASHGFVVVSLSHPYDSSSITMPDGRVIAANSMTRAPVVSREDWATYTQYQKRFTEVSADEAQTRALFKQMHEYMEQKNFPYVQSILPWAQDTNFVIDQLDAINAGTDKGVVGPAKRFSGKMDLENLGMFGMSFGGSTAGYVCMTNPRCKAGLNLDGWQFGNSEGRTMNVPFMLINSGTGLTPGWMYDGGKSDFYLVNVKRSTHGNFADLSLIFPLLTWTSTPKFAFLGKIDAPQMERIMTQYSLAFFQQYLQGKPQPLLKSAPSRELFPDVAFKATLAPPSPEGK